MKNRIEQKMQLSKTGFNAFLLNEIADIKATQLAIMDALAAQKAENEDVTFDDAFKELNKKRLAYLNDIMSKILNDYGSLPDSERSN